MDQRFIDLGMESLTASMLDDAGYRYVFGVTDLNERLALGVTEDGHSAMGRMHVEHVAGGIPFAVVDRGGRMAFYIDRSGVSHLTLPSSTPVDYDPPSTLHSMASQKTDYMHLFSYGQSLSRGSTTFAPVSTEQLYNNVTFLGGVLPRGSDAEVDYSAFKALVEEDVYGEASTEAETPVSGLCNRLVALCVEGGGVGSDWIFVGTAPGQGGQSIADLCKGTARWTDMMEQVTAAKALAAAAGKSYSVWGMAWAQGEADYSDNTTYADYYAQLIQLKNDFAEDVAAITGQLWIPPVITYQTAAHRRYGKDNINIANAQWRASRDDPDIIMACPIYHLPHAADSLHLEKDSSQQLGRYYAKAFYAAVLQGLGDWRPLEPRSVFWQDRVIDITCNVPVGALTFDTSLVTEAPNKGFDIWTEGETGPTVLVDAISSVTIVGDDRVRIVLASDPPTDALLTYARGRTGDPATSGPIDGPRGNLRDQGGDSDNYLDSTSATRYMHNWCVMFEFQRDQGDI
ncbi:MAG: sialate O-acetylesterase [Syntrophobacteraceae bacterium]